MVYSFSLFLTAIFPFEFQGGVREINQREGSIGTVISGPSFLVCAMGDISSMKRLTLLSFYLELIYLKKDLQRRIRQNIC